MKNKLTFWAAIFFVQTTIAQHTYLDWAKRMGKTGEDAGYSIATDAQGNVYTTGYFSGMVDFDPNSETQLLTSKGYEDIFVSKLDNKGNLIWAKQLGGTGSDMAYSLSLDAQNNILLTGHFSETADFANHKLHSVGKHDAFICKLDAQGNVLWTKQLGGLYDDCSNALATDVFGNVYATGHFYGIAHLDSLRLEATNADFPDMFLLKLNGDGALQWATTTTGNYLKAGNALALDTRGNIYTTGIFKDTIYFNSNAQKTYLLSNGKYDAFISKFSNDGALAWAKNLGGTGSDIGYAIAADAQGNVYAAGQFEKKAHFSNLLCDEKQTISATGKQDIFVLKLNNDGTLQWLQQLGGVGADAATSLVLDASANVYLTGYFSDSADFDPSANEVRLHSAGHQDIFIAKLDANGALIWAKQLGESGQDKAQGIALDASGAIHTTGSFENMVDFDINAGVMELTAGGASDIFIQKLKQCAPQYSELEITSCGSFTLNQQIYTASGTYTQVMTTPLGCETIITLHITINDGAH